MVNKRNIKDNPGNLEKKLYQDEIEDFLKKVIPVDGTPISLVLPSEICKESVEAFAAGLKQVEGAHFDEVFLFAQRLPDRELDCKDEIIKIYNLYESPDSLKSAGENLEKDIYISLARNLTFQIKICAPPLPTQFWNLDNLWVKFFPNCTIIPLELPRNATTSVQNLTEVLAKYSKNRSILVISLSQMTNQLLTFMETMDLDPLPNFISTISHEYRQYSFSPAFLAIDYAVQKGAQYFTHLKKYPITSSEEVFAAAMFWNYIPPTFSYEQQQALIQLAFDSIRYYLQHGKPPYMKSGDLKLNRKAGVFVTIKELGALRGCIGHIVADTPIYQIVQDMAIAAATCDPRFPPLQLKNLDNISTKISILSPLQRMGHEEIIIGKHGVLIEKEDRRSLLLPEVPVDRSWNKQQFLENLCLKAGLERNAWKTGGKLYGFTTIELSLD